MFVPIKQEGRCPCTLGYEPTPLQLPPFSFGNGSPVVRPRGWSRRDYFCKSNYTAETKETCASLCLRNSPRETQTSTKRCRLWSASSLFGFGEVHLRLKLSVVYFSRLWIRGKSCSGSHCPSPTPPSGRGPDGRGTSGTRTLRCRFL